MRIKRLFLALAFGLGFTFTLLNGASLLAAHAAYINDVNTTSDNTTGGDGDCTLREAIHNANIDGDGSSGDCTAGGGDDTITLPAGTYVLTQTVAGDDGGDLNIWDSDSLTITGQGPANTIIDANGIDRVLDIGSGAGTTVVISGVKIMGGNTSGYGGGVNIPDANLTLINTIIYSNTANGRGGGVFFGFGSSNVSGGQIVSNTAGSGGGGFYINFGEVTLSGGQILSNTVSGSLLSGGGVYINVTSAVFTQTGDSLFAYNRAHSGGGVYVANGRAVLSGGQIISNSVSGAGGGVQNNQGSMELIGVNIFRNKALVGGGVHLSSGSTTLSACQIMSNTASGNGGGVIIGSGPAILNQGEIIANSSGTKGGGVFVSSDNATLSGVQIISNTADYAGGGIFVDEGSTTVSGGQIMSNTADSGGGVYVSQSDAVFTQTGGATIAYNTANGSFSFYGGGGVYIDSGDASLIGGQIVSNTAESGGGVYVYQNNAVFTQTAGTTIAYNTANGVDSDEGGGGVYVYSGDATLSGGQILSNTAEHGGGLNVYYGSAMLSGMEIVDNTANNQGGGIFIGWGSSKKLSVEGGQIISNTASSGGGVYITQGSATLSGTDVVSNTATNKGGGITNYLGALTIINTTISKNTSASSGGGLYSETDFASTYITYTTIASNTAGGGGGGIHRSYDGVITLQDTILAHNGANNCNKALISNGHNLEDADTCGLTATGDITGTNPLLGPLTDVGNTLVHPLLDGSLAINAGICLTDVTTIDQRGVSRPFGIECDIGAYEYFENEIFLPLVLRSS